MPALINSRHERFAQEVVAGKSVSEAYEAAGFKKNAGNARRLRLDEAVSNRIEALLDDRRRIDEAAFQIAVEKLAITKERVLEELARIGFANIADYVDVSADAPVIRLQDVPRDKLAALSEITTETVFERTHSQGAPTEVRRVKIKLWDKRGPLVDIGKHLGMFKDKVEVSGPNGGPIQTEDVSARDRIAGRIAGIAARIRAGGDTGKPE